MKKFSLSLALITLALAVSCKEENKEPQKKVIYEDAAKPKAQGVQSDSSQIKVADLPIQMEGSKYLVHPIGDYRIYEGRSKSEYGSSNTDKVSFSISNYDRFEITGYLQNLKFQHQDSTAMRSLTDKPVIIQTASYLNTMATSAKRQLFAYTVIDADTNRDGKMDGGDIKSLYVSNANGTAFTKLSSDLQELIDWNLVESMGRIYFRSIEDTNKNGQFDKDDVVRYHYCNLASKEWKIEDYDPVK